MQIFIHLYEGNINSDEDNRFRAYKYKKLKEICK